MKPETFEELFDQLQIDADNGVIYNKQMYLNDAKLIHKEQLKRFIRVMVIKKIERSFERQKRTMSTRTQAEQNLLGAFLTVSEQDFKDSVKELI